MTTARKGWAQRQAARFVGAIASAFFVAIFAVLVAPCAAWARDYSISKVDIDATLSSDGTLTVVEERTFSFDGSFNGVWVNNKNIETKVLQAGDIIQLGNFSLEFQSQVK